MARAAKHTKKTKTAKRTRTTKHHTRRVARRSIISRRLHVKRVSAAMPASAGKGDVPEWLTVARSYIGLHEGTTLHANPKVVKFFVESGHAEIHNDHTTPWCFTGETEILTERGWIRFDALDDENVYQADMNGALSIVKPIRKVEKNYQGDVFDVDHRSVKLTCDAGHRWFGSWSRHNHVHDPRCFGTLDQLTSDGLSIPTVYSSTKGLNLTNDQLIMVAAFISDGFTRWDREDKSRPLSIEFSVSKQRKIDVLSGLGPYNTYIAKRAYGPLTKVPITTFSFKYPEFFGTVFDDYKRLSWSFINSLSIRQAQTFIHAYAKFDGNDGASNVILYTSDKDMRDDLVTIALLAGYLPNVQSERKSSLSKRPSWCISFSPVKASRHIKQQHVTRRQFKGRMYCVEVPSGLIVVRGTNGTPVLTGNCAAFVGAVLEECHLPNTGSLWALSYSSYGQKLDGPIVGAIGYKKRHGGGHVFFVVGFDKSHVWALGGNQDDQVCIERLQRSVIAGYRWPPGVPISEAHAPAAPYAGPAVANASEK